MHHSLMLSVYFYFEWENYIRPSLLCANAIYNHITLTAIDQVLKLSSFTQKTTMDKFSYFNYWVQVEKHDLVFKESSNC